MAILTYDEFTKQLVGGKRIFAITSGFFAPLNGSGHLHYFRDAYRLGNYTDYMGHGIGVIVNNDMQLLRKKGYVFQNEQERLLIIRNIKWVQFADISEDTDNSVAKSLEHMVSNIRSCCDGYYKDYEVAFCNGGDRSTAQNSKELETCNRLGIDVVVGVGGTDKLSSSSDLLENYRSYVLRQHNIETWVAILRRKYEQAVDSYRLAHAECVGIDAASNVWDYFHKDDGVGGISKNPYNRLRFVEREEAAKLHAQNMKEAYEFAVDTFIAPITTQSTKE